MRVIEVGRKHEQAAKGWSMAGQTIELMARQIADFSYLINGASETRTVVARIPTERHTTVELLVRIHTNGIRSVSDGSITVRLVQDASTPQDGAKTFLKATAITGGSVTLNASSTNGTFTVSAVTGTVGSMVALQVVATQDSQTPGLGLAADISVELNMKSAS